MVQYNLVVSYGASPAYAGSSSPSTALGFIAGLIHAPIAGAARSYNPASQTESLTFSGVPLPVVLPSATSLAAATASASQNVTLSFLVTYPPEQEVALKSTAAAQGYRVAPDAPAPPLPGPASIAPAPPARGLAWWWWLLIAGGGLLVLGGGLAACLLAAQSTRRRRERRRRELRKLQGVRLD